MSSPVASRPRRRWLTGLLAAIVAGLAALWVYALFFAPKEYRLSIDDPSWVEQADAVCARYATRIEELPPARQFADVEPLTEALRQRAEVLDDANALVADQVTELRALPPPGNERGRELVARWLADWDLYLADRSAQGERWRGGSDGALRVTADESGAPITEFMDSFATGNRMPACEVPGDV